MEVGGIVIGISLFVSLYVFALWYLLTRYIYRSMKDKPGQPIQLNIVVESMPGKNKVT